MLNNERTQSLRRTLIPYFFIFSVVIFLGTIGYQIIEGWSFFDALYMTVITLSTVGFGETRPLSSLGRLFTIGLIVSGVFVLAYGFSDIGEYLLTSGVGTQVRKRRMMRVIGKMSGHVIVCGYGRVGRSAVQSLLESNPQVVVVEADPSTAEEVQGAGLPLVAGDATKDETLREAGIERARGLMVCGGKDADNLFVVLSARTLNPDIFIVVRSVDAENESKMRRAGANRVVSPYKIGGSHMAKIITRPNVTEFLEVLSLSSGLELWLEELLIKSDSSLAGHTVFEADLRRRTGATLVALLREPEMRALTPDENTRLEVGDRLIVLGTREQLATLETLSGISVEH